MHPSILKSCMAKVDKSSGSHSVFPAHHNLLSILGGIHDDVLLKLGLHISHACHTRLVGSSSCIVWPTSSNGPSIDSLIRSPFRALPLRSLCLLKGHLPRIVLQTIFVNHGKVLMETSPTQNPF